MCLASNFEGERGITCHPILPASVRVGAGAQHIVPPVSQFVVGALEFLGGTIQIILS
jgi:hypothetical protein